jgi:hypothetical protein
MIVFSVLLKKAEDFDCFPYVRHRSGIYFLWPGPAGLGISWFVIVSCTFWIAPQSVLQYMCNLAIPPCLPIPLKQRKPCNRVVS